MDKLLGRNAYARHRGCSPNAVAKAEADGRISAAVVRDESGLFLGIKWQVADQLWAQNTDPLEAAKSGKTTAPQSVEVPTELLLDRGSAARGPSAGTGGELLANKAEQAKYDLLLTQAKYYREAGALTSAAGVRKEAMETARSVRNAMLAIPDRIAPVLDPANPARAHKLLTGEIQKVLRELSVGLDERSIGPGGSGAPAASGEPVRALQ